MKRILLFIPAGICIVYFSIIIWQHFYSTGTIVLVQNDSNTVHSTSKTDVIKEPVNKHQLHGDETNQNTTTEPFAMPEILKGTFPDGKYDIDSNGNLVISKTIRNRFDYYFSAVSEVGIENCIKLIEEDIKNVLPESAANEALKILTLYINYKKSLRSNSAISTGLPDSPQKLIVLQNEVKNRKEIRRKHMTPEMVEAFFGESERYDEYSIRCMAINQSIFSNDTEKRAQLKKTENMLDETVRKRHEKYWHINELAQKKMR